MWIPARLQPYLFATLASLSLAVLTAYDLSRERSRSIEDVRGETANVARLLEENTRQVVRRIDALLALAVARRIELGPLSAGQTEAQALTAQLNSLMPRDGRLRAILWLDSQGQQLATADVGRQISAGAATSAVSEALVAPWLTRARSAPAATLVLGQPVRDDRGRWLWPVGRLLPQATASTVGAAHALVTLVELSVLQPVLDAVDSGKNGFATLFLMDGAMLATAPSNPSFLEKNWFDTPMFKVHLPRAPVGTVQQVMVRDGTERIYSYRALPDYPVVISMGVSMTDALGDWRDRIQRDLALWGLVSAAFVLGAVAMSRNYVRREAAEQQAAEQARETQAIIDHAADGILTVDADGVITSANPICAAWFGWPQPQLKGQAVQTLLPGWPNPLQAPAAITRPGVLQRFEGLGRRRDGSVFSTEVAITEVLRASQPLRIALLRDVTEPRRAQAAVAQAHDAAQRSEAFLRNITDNLPLRIAYVDQELRYRFVNQAHCERFFLPRAAILGRTREQITGKPLPQALEQAVQQVLLGQPQRLEFEEIDAGGERVVETYLVPDFGASGPDDDPAQARSQNDKPRTVLGFFSATTDVTDRHRQQRQLERALAERETLLREVYHRVKNNLQVVQSLLNLQRRTLPEGPARGALDDSMQRVYAMALVHEKLYQTGDLDAVSLPDYVHELLRHLGDGAGAARRDIRLLAEVDPIEAPLELALPLGLLVTELVANSLKHAFVAGRSGSIEVKLQRQPGGLKLVVQNDGASLPPDFDVQHSASMGLQLASSLAGQLGGALTGSPGTAGGAVFESLLSRFIPTNENPQPPSPDSPA